ncbi:glycosyltransferase family 2 protein [Shinella sp. BYT-45]|uniref:glycosyltransferase family 2 protein n=1 Tax=Shinella sp. BYT-45 TaxID=3377377 RepID=UPI00397F7C12
MNNPEVTIVVPSYNSGHFLEWTLDSIAAQTFENFECVVVDDCSTDDSFKRARKHFADPRFRLITHKMNVGLSGARNTGIRAARGEFVAFLDSDDLMMKNSIEVRLNTCRWGRRTSDRFAGSYCGSVQIDEPTRTAPDSQPMGLPFVTFASSHGHCPFNANQPMIRKDVLRRAGGFNHGLKQAEDFDLWLRILRAGFIFAPAKFASVTYRRRAGSMVRAQPLAHLDLSLSIINSAERPLSVDQLDWSPQYRMSKPLSSYAAQEKKIQRTLEFVGMNFASSDPESPEELAKLVKREIPDLHLLTHSEKAIEGIIQNGVRRQKSIAGPLPDADRESAENLAALIVSSVRKSYDGSASVVDRTPIYPNPSQDRPWFSNLQSKYQIVFIPHSAYHVWTISLIGKSLNEIGIEFITVDISAEWRDGKVRSAAAEHGIELIALSEFVLGRYKPRAIVTFNDWDPVTRPILVAAKAAGIRTVAIVEGIQDYDDADVHWRRFAYKTSDVVLLPGDFDKKYFEGHNAIVESVGVPRIESLRTKEKRVWQKDKTPSVLINCNFSYGVLVEHRDQWLSDCVEAIQELGMKPIISRHPADTGKLFPELVTSRSFYDEIEDCDVSIQRFASGVLEALARDVGVIYYNPHNEKVDKFQLDPMGAYTLAYDKEALRSQLRSWWDLHEMARENGGPFLDHHSGPLGDGAIHRCASALRRHMGTEPSESALSAFRKNLAVIDNVTSAFSQVRFNNEPLFPDPNTAEEALLRLGGEKYRNALDMDLKPIPNISDNRQESNTPRTLADRLRSIQLVGEKNNLLLPLVSSALLIDSEDALDVLETCEDIRTAVNRELDRRQDNDGFRGHYEKAVLFAKSRRAATKL